MSEGGGPLSRAAGPRWTATELGARVASSAVLVLVALLVAYLGSWPFALLWLAAGVVVALEWTGMSRVEPLRPLQVVIAGTLLVVMAVYVLGGPPLISAGALGLGLAGTAAFAHGARSKLWATSGLAYSAVLALVPPLVRDDPALGLTAILWMFAVVWGTDIAAYFTGRRLGGPKLWPRVSPKKTWSGFLGGAVAATLLGVGVVVVARLFGAVLPVSLATLAAASLIASVASQIGDLAESALKRRFDVKDSGQIIPGHGGAMDRLDGFWAVALLAGLALAARHLGAT